MKTWILCACAALTFACGAKGPEGPFVFPSAPLLTVTSDSGALTVAVRTAPAQPPTRSTVIAAQYTVTNPAGAPVDGLALNVLPWMPAMAHGMSLTPEITAKGGGVYEIDNLEFAMPGTWELRTDFSGPVTDHATPSFQVQ